MITANREQIAEVLDYEEVIAEIEQGFVLYTDKMVVVPPIGYLPFTQPPGDTHIKYGYIKNSEQYVIKIASNFYQNPRLGLPSGNGMMLVFSQKTGATESLLMDEGLLTDIRTAAAGAVVARHFAPSHVTRIGIIGTGMQARLQPMLLQEVIGCRQIVVWGRGEPQLAAYKKDMEAAGFTVITTLDITEVTGKCNLIITTTPSTEALLMSDHVRKGTHITAVGADAEGKQELDPKLFAKADIIIADSIDQCIKHGDLAHAVQAEMIDPKTVVELGAAIHDPFKIRQDDTQITIADLTGIAVQDIQIAQYVSRKLSPANEF